MARMTHKVLIRKIGISMGYLIRYLCFKLFSQSYLSSSVFSDHHNLLLLASVSETDLPTDPKKPFRCTYCRKEFAHLTSLESHMEQIHKGEAKHSCEECGRSFSSKSNLTAHRKIHSGMKTIIHLIII